MKLSATLLQQVNLWLVPCMLASCAPPSGDPTGATTQLTPADTAGKRIIAKDSVPADSIPALPLEDNCPACGRG